MMIEDGKGKGVLVEVDSKQRLVTTATVIADELVAAVDGEAYNINTGNITLSTAGTLLYMKNNGSSPIIINSIAVGIGGGTASDSGEIMIIRNPTGGDLITDATVVDINQNRNFDSSNSLTIDVYKGKSGGTITGGSDLLLIYQNVNSRLFASLNIVLPKGTSIAVKLDPKLTSGSVKCYCAFVLYTK